MQMLTFRAGSSLGNLALCFLRSPLFVLFILEAIHLGLMLFMLKNLLGFISSVRRMI